MGSDGCCTHWVFWMGIVLYPLGIDTSTSGGDTRLALLHTLLHSYTQSNPFQQTPSPKYSTGKYQHHLLSFYHFVPNRQSTVSWIESDLHSRLSPGLDQLYPLYPNIQSSPREFVKSSAVTGGTYPRERHKAFIGDNIRYHRRNNWLPISLRVLTKYDEVYVTLRLFLAHAELHAATGK